MVTSDALTTVNRVSVQLWAQLNVEADLDSSAEDDDDAFHKDRTWLGPEDDNLSSYVLQPTILPCQMQHFHHQ